MCGSDEIWKEHERHPPREERAPSVFLKQTSGEGFRNEHISPPVCERLTQHAKGEIEDIFLDLRYKFGFQRDSIRSMVCCSLFYQSVVKEFPCATVLFVV
jgi:hypothetical protein